MNVDLDTHYDDSEKSVVSRIIFRIACHNNEKNATFEHPLAKYDRPPGGSRLAGCGVGGTFKRRRILPFLIALDLVLWHASRSPNLL